MTRLMRPGSVDTLPGVFVFSTLFSSVPTSTLAASRKLRLAVVLSMSVPLAIETAPHFTVQIKFHNAVRCVKNKKFSPCATLRLGQLYFGNKSFRVRCWHSVWCTQLLENEFCS